MIYILIFIILAIVAFVGFLMGLSIEMDRDMRSEQENMEDFKRHIDHGKES